MQPNTNTPLPSSLHEHDWYLQWCHIMWWGKKAVAASHKQLLAMALSVASCNAWQRATQPKMHKTVHNQLHFAAWGISIVPSAPSVSYAAH